MLSRFLLPQVDEFRARDAAADFGSDEIDATREGHAGVVAAVPAERAVTSGRGVASAMRPSVA